MVSVSRWGVTGRDSDRDHRPGPDDEARLIALCPLPAVSRPVTPQRETETMMHVSNLGFSPRALKRDGEWLDVPNWTI